MHLIKSVIILAHGNADVERGFSTNALLVTLTVASFSPASIVALQTIKDALCTVGFNVLRVPITLELLRHFQNAHVCFKAEKEDEARKSEQKAAKLKAINQIADEVQIKAEKLKNKEGKLTNKITTVQQLLSEGNSKLTDAFKKKDDAYVVVAQAMLSFASLKLSITQIKLTDIMTELHNIKRPAKHESVDQ